MSRFISSKEFNGADYKAGAKAKGLALLKNSGFLCPDFYVLDYSFLSEINNDAINLKDVLQQWVKENNIDIGKLWAVRSSTQEEDGESKSYAGLFKTEINISTDCLEQSILNVLDSYSGLNNDAYSSNVKTGYGIIIQEMIMPDYSGVIFSHNPNDQRDDTVFIDIIPGAGENLVSGKEKAYSVKFKAGSLIFDETRQVYNGEIFNQNLVKVSKSGNEIKNELCTIWPQLIKGAKRLSKIKKTAVDIEFCIAEKKIYWLQVRPVTTGKDESYIWDNTATEGNYPGVIMPLSISLIQNSFSKAYRGLAAYLGMPEKLLSKNEELLKYMIGEIQGGLYYNVTAWQKLICQLPFGKKISKSLTSVWGMEKAGFYPEKNRFACFTKTRMLINLVFSILFLNSIRKKYIKRYSQIQNKIDAIELNSLTYRELTEIYKELEQKMIDNWEAPLLNNLFTVVLMLISGKVIEKSKLNVLYPNFINDSLIAQSQVISVKIVKEFKAILNDIKADTNLSRMFSDFEPEDIFKMLQTSKKSLAQRISDYVNNYGDRSDEPELKMETVTYRENPVKFIAYIKSNLNADSETGANPVNFDYRAVVKENYKWNIPYRILVLWTVKQMIKRVSDRENFRYMRTCTYGLVRRIFREMDNELLKENLILQKNDSLYLNLEELLNTELLPQFKTIIHNRKELYSEYSDKNRITRYKQTGLQFVPVEICAGHESDTIIKGTGCCSGIVKAEVKIVDNDVSVAENAGGKIYVANYFEPGKLGLFSKAAGLISARGNLLGHTAILCREMGIPSIVGAKTVLAKLKDGDIIEMNGSTGQIEIVKRDE